MASDWYVITTEGSTGQGGRYRGEWHICSRECTLKWAQSHEEIVTA